MQSTSSISALTDIFVSPTKAFNAINEKKGWSWAAFIAVSLVMTLASYLFFSSTDPQFLLEQQLATLDPNMSAEERKMAEEGMQATSGMQVWFAIGGGIFGLIIANALYALYLLLISKMDANCDKKFGDWFGFSVWTNMPLVISSLGIIILVLTASTDQLSISLMNYASLNQLVLGLEPQSKFFALTEAFNIFVIWSIALTVIGLKSWTNFSANKALVLGILPSAIFYIGWAIFALV
ncbi:YIP1 family protein [Shewanella sp. 202IG2-18]|uniref:YIP1 family protein n=1 Tax=Parashewanella hymeniacidonis TaxID=2807618 RepID=UPI00196221B2|nr:YIP1 family protein [Parashewanella hymeniacidonis]MBM7073176.1 YIP1 family protein [Parashewanella hymeniacidonis]